MTKQAFEKFLKTERAEQRKALAEIQAIKVRVDKIGARLIKTVR